MEEMVPYFPGNTNRLHNAETDVITAKIENTFCTFSEKRKYINNGHKINKPNAWTKEK